LSFEPKVKISKGEYAGRLLRQDSTALNLAASKIETKNHHFVCSVGLDRLPVSWSSGVPDNQILALVGWITNENQQPIQAIGGGLIIN